MVYPLIPPALFFWSMANLIVPFDPPPPPPPPQANATNAATMRTPSPLARTIWFLHVFTGGAKKSLLANASPHSPPSSQPESGRECAGDEFGHMGGRTTTPWLTIDLYLPRSQAVLWISLRRIRVDVSAVVSIGECRAVIYGPDETPWEGGVRAPRLEHRDHPQGGVTGCIEAERPAGTRKSCGRGHLGDYAVSRGQLAACGRDRPVHGPIQDGGGVVRGDGVGAVIGGVLVPRLEGFDDRLRVGNDVRGGGRDGRIHPDGICTRVAHAVGVLGDSVTTQERRRLAGAENVRHLGSDHAPMIGGDAPVVDRLSPIVPGVAHERREVQMAVRVEVEDADDAPAEPGEPGHEPAGERLPIRLVV